MLTFNTGSVCDVCAEEYGPSRRPHSISCGHVMCATCCDAILEKTSPRLAPVCPFCREEFAKDSVRLIRVDFSSSGVSTPKGGWLEANEEETNDALSRIEARFHDRLQARARAEAKRLEDKVALVAQKKCSVDEVKTLHSELQRWLHSDAADEKTSSLHLSAALLRAILLNHLAHSEASRAAKNLELALRARIDDLEMSKAKVEAELSKQKTSLSQKTQECQSLCAELNRLKTRTAASSLGITTSNLYSSSASATSTPRPQSISSVFYSPPLSPTHQSSAQGGFGTSTGGTSQSASTAEYPPRPYPVLPRPISSSTSADAAHPRSPSRTPAYSTTRTGTSTASKPMSAHQKLLQDTFRTRTPLARAAAASPRPPIPPKPTGLTIPTHSVSTPSPAPGLGRSKSDAGQSQRFAIPPGADLNRKGMTSSRTMAVAASGSTPRHAFSSQ